jgi:zinc and cadmium transporter
MNSTALIVLLGFVAGIADVLGGLILVRTDAKTSRLRAYLRYFIALSGGFMLATVCVEMIPESLRYSMKLAPLVLGGYCLIHLLEHTIVPHFHFGEETHTGAFAHAHTGYSIMLGLSTHTFFDGIAIASGFVFSPWIGMLVFVSILLHKLPEGFTMGSIMLASGRGRTAAFYSAVLLGVTTVAGTLLVSAIPNLAIYGLPLSAGVTLYVAATDLMPEVNREHGIKMALVFFLGVALFFTAEYFGKLAGLAGS